MNKISKGMFRITSYVADQAGCANIRIVIPFILLNQLQVKNFQFQAYFNNIFTKDLNFYRNSTIIQFQRAATQKHLEFFEVIRRKIKILSRSALVYEIDDDLLNIPQWNFAADYYVQYKPYITEMLSRADGVVVSTQTLKTLYSKYNNNIWIIPNHLPSFTWNFTGFNNTANKKLRILYPCSSNHFACKKGVSGGDIGPVFLNYIRKTVDDYEWNFAGGIPMELADLSKAGKIKHHAWHSVYEYPRFLKSLNADIGIAPLQINEFNRSKSDIKAQEYTALGIPGVYTKIDPYGSLTLQSESDEEFISHIEKLKDIDARFKTWAADYATLSDNLFWEDEDYKNLKRFVKTYLNLIGKTTDAF